MICSPVIIRVGLLSEGRIIIMMGHVLLVEVIGGLVGECMSHINMFMIYFTNRFVVFTLAGLVRHVVFVLEELLVVAERGMVSFTSMNRRLVKLLLLLMLISCWLSRLMLGLLGLQVVLLTLLLRHFLLLLFLFLLRLACLLFRCLWFFLDFLLIKRVQLELRFSVIVMLILLGIRDSLNTILHLLVVATKMAWLRLARGLSVDQLASRW